MSNTAPRRMPRHISRIAIPGILMFIAHAVTVGSLWVIVNASVKYEVVLGHIAATGLGVMSFQMFFFAAFAFAAALAFGQYARKYRMVDNYRDMA
jgi:POT family proton-dependent oligopeptide transporter